jgi:ATP-dependent Clp protease ATP-binding subunit ClpC
LIKILLDFICNSLIFFVYSLRAIVHLVQFLTNKKEKELMDDNFSPRVKDVITYSKEEALRLGHDFIGTEHLMLGLLRDGNGKAISILKALEIDLDYLRRKIEILTPANPTNSPEAQHKTNLHLTRQAERALKTTFLEAKLFQSSSIIAVYSQK